MGKRPEIHMYDGTWKHSETQRFNPIPYPHALRMYWPVPMLPVKMGTIDSAIQIPEDPNRHYHAWVSVTFLPEKVVFHTIPKYLGDPRKSGEFTYEELAAVISYRRDPPGPHSLYFFRDPHESPESDKVSLVGNIPQSVRRAAGRLTMIYEESN